MPFTRYFARKRIRKATKVSQKLAQYQATPEPAFLSNQRPVQKKRDREAKWQGKIVRIDQKISRARAKLAAARVGLLGTRSIRKKFWSRRERKWIQKRTKPAAKLAAASQSRQQTENAFSAVYQSNVAAKQATKNSALLKMNRSLDKVARSAPRLQRKMRETIDVIQFINNSFPASNQVPAAQFDDLRNKIQTEANNSDRRTGAYRLLRIQNELEILENVMDAGQKTRAEQILAQLINLNENPPA